MKKTLALLLCVCLLLGLVPSGILIPVSAATEEVLTVDENGLALCPACNQVAQWTALDHDNTLDTISDGKHHHLYLSKDVDARKIAKQYLNMTTSGILCLHLNGHDLYHGGYVMIGGGTTLNIMGPGSMIFTATNTSNDYHISGLYVNGGTLNLYSGTIGVAEDAAEEARPAIRIRSGKTTVKNATVTDHVYAPGGTLNLEEGAVLDTIQVDSAAKLFVKSNWTGSAYVDFQAKPVNNVVPAANGGSDGAFTGTLKTKYAVTFQGSGDGTLTATGLNAGLVLDANNQAMCHVCNQKVTWTAISSNATLGTINNGTHNHLYLAKDIDARKIANQYLNLLNSGTKLCLHLNGYTLQYGGYLMAGSGTVLNIFGSGQTIFTATNTSNAYDISGLYVNYGTLNIYGGTHSVAEDAAAEGRPTIQTRADVTGYATVKNAEIEGRFYVPGGTLTIDEGAKLEKIQVDPAGKLVIKKTWTGSAVADFNVTLDENRVPAANGAAEGSFSGTLKQPDGTKIQLDKDGRLYCGLLLDDKNQAECPVCEKVVTWTPIKNGERIGYQLHKGHLHYYLAEDVTSQAGEEFMELAGDSQACLHLNGHNLTMSGHMQLYLNTVLNVIGTGNVDMIGTAKAEAYMESTILVLGGTANLYGGTYSVSGKAAGKPTILVKTQKVSVANVIGATVKGDARVELGTMSLQGPSTVDKIYVGTSGKLTVAKNWTGSAVADFAVLLEDDVMPTKNGASEGDFTGVLTMSDGRRLWGNDAGTLVYKIVLELDTKSQAMCPVCNEVVTWTAISDGKTLGSLSDGKHYHKYLAADIDARKIANQYLNMTGSGTKLCLHLNGHTLRYGGYFMVGGGTVLNIMGSGNMIFTATNTSDEYDISGLYVNSGTLNLYNGVYSVAEDALKEGIPTIQTRNNTTSSIVTMKDVTVEGTVNVPNGTAVLEKSAVVSHIEVDTPAKLKVDAAWFGAAKANFAVGLTGEEIPAANGISTGDFLGGLRLEDGTHLQGKDGKLVVRHELDLRMTEDGVAYCPLCYEVVKWIPLNSGSYIGRLPSATDAHHHYYFAEDNMTTYAKDYLVVIETGNTVCLYLNGKNVTLPTGLRHKYGTLNIFGDGNLDFTGTGSISDSTNGALIYSPNGSDKYLNIYGGTYSSSCDGPVMYLNGGNYTVEMIAKLYGNTNINGTAQLTQCQFYLNDAVKVAAIDGSNTASIRVAENWTGSATVDYFTQVNEAYVSEYNGRSDGNFIGGLMLADGRRLIGESGKLRVLEEGSLLLNSKNQGYCETCQEVVTWKNIEGEVPMGTLKDGGHHHYYVSNVLGIWNDSEYLLRLQNTDLCLHLNGKKLVYGNPMEVTGKDATLTIMGKGDISVTNDEAMAIQAKDGAIVNILGGTYAAGLDTDAAVLVKNASFASANVSGGTLTLDGDATVKSISVGAKGKLDLADSWTGSATAAFAAAATGNTLSGLTGTAYKGKLTLADGRSVEKTVIGGETIDKNLSYRFTADGAEFVAYTGTGDYLMPTTIGGKPITAIAEGAFDNFSGTLYIGKHNTLALQYAKKEKLTFVEAATFTREDGSIQLLDNAENLTFDKDTTLDLNGYSVGGVTVKNATLSVMDSATDDFTVADGIYGKITGASGTVKAAAGYMKVKENGALTFHRVDLDIYAMSLRSSNVGVYYQSRFAADEVVAKQVQSYGIALSTVGNPTKKNMETECLYTVFEGFKAGKDANTGSSTLLEDIMSKDNGDEKNAANAATNVYGRAYIKTADGYFFGNPVQRTLRDQVELADANFESLTKLQKENVQTMVDDFQSVTENWDVFQIGTYKKDRLWFDTPAPDTGDGFEQYSLPIGNGYMGVSVFGGTDSETLSISDKEMYNPRTSPDMGYTPPAGPDGEKYMSYSQGGYTNMCKAYIDFGHDFEKVTNYQRDLILDTAEAHVRYTYDGVTYNRTYFASYPDNVTVMKLDASEAGALTFTLRPEATYIRDYCTIVGDGMGKTGTVTASGDTAIVAGTLTAFNINYEAQFKVIPVGGTMVANKDGTITVTGADSAVILLSVDTNYVLEPKTLTAANAEKLDPNSYPHDRITKVIKQAAAKSYDELLQTHLEDYQGLYGRVELELGGEPSAELTTGEMMRSYRAGDFDPYIEELLFKYGRYLLIASSRSGTLPANLQGVWQYYSAGAWGGCYVYNINLQMNYWSCFATNLAELFEPNIEFFDAIYPTLQANADTYLTAVKSPSMSPAGTGANGIAVGAVGTPYLTPKVNASVSTHTGPGSTGYTSDLFWQYYQFTMDKDALENKLYRYLEGSATFLSKTLEDYGGKWLVSHSASPENNMWFTETFQTVGTMFDQMMTRESFVQVQSAAQVLGFTDAKSPILAIVEDKLDKLDHVNIGKSGQVKEFREEEYYGEFGLYEHHGMAQLVGVYPGTSITSETDAWQDAAAVTAIERGINYTGHQASFKQLVWARLGDGAMSYLLGQEHIVKYVRDNLWNTHPPFQIDGNFGYTAGVAEMLLQSHEGYIKVLPAIPQQWATGSYKGLTARGGFEVDVAWEDGSATEIAITSNAGEPCSLNQFRVSTAKVTDSKGNVVNFTVDNENQITFATVEGETYYITGLQAKPYVEAPADLTVTDGSKLSWKESRDAVSYNIYRAVNDQATYELVAKNVTATTYTYLPTDLKVGDQLILRITAVNKDGVESEGVRIVTSDLAVNANDTKAMQAATDAYAAYVAAGGAIDEYMVYLYEGRLVVLQNGTAIGVYESEASALIDLFDNPYTTKNEAENVALEATTDANWFICDTGYTTLTYVAFGDSITYGIDGNYRSTDANYRMSSPYPNLVGDTLGIGTVNNQGVSGASFCPHTSRPNMTTKILSFTGEADIISLLLGVNDFTSKLPLGDPSCRDNTTIYGCLYLISEYLTTKYPDAFIFYMTPFQYKSPYNGTYYLSDVATAVKTVANEFGIPVLDMYNEGKYELEMNVSPNDGVHPSQQHHIKYTAPLICDFLKKNFKD